MKIRILVFIILLVVPTVSYGEDFFMKNGDHFSGSLITVENGNLIIETDYGKMTISKDKILKILFSDIRKKDLNNITDLSIEDILLFIKSSSNRFYLDGKRISGESLSNSVRLKKMMSAPELRDIKLFIQKFLTRSEKGKLIKVKVNGKKINIVDWLDSKIANLELKVVSNENKKKRRVEFKRLKRK